MKKKEAFLTAAEKARLEKFEAKSLQLIEEGYTRQNLTIGFVKVNVLSAVIMLPFVLLVCVLFFALNFDTVKNRPYNYFSIQYLIGILLTIPCIFIHEGIHGLCWGLSCASGFKSISFGFNIKVFAPYCSVCEVLTRKQYITGALMPTIVLGFITGIIAGLTGAVWILIESILLIFCGGGDFMITLNILKFRKKNTDILYYDHPTEVGTVVFYKKKTE